MTALDCIAEMFERDEDGNFLELHLFFSTERDIEKCPGEVTLSDFRSLVYSKLNDGIFRLYREYDPVYKRFGKINERVLEELSRK